MTIRPTGLALAALLSMAAHAASISTTATLTGTATLNAASGAVAATGSGTLTNIGPVTFTASASIGSTALSGPITITVTSGGTLTGTMTLPLSILSGGSSSASASVVITGGTGTYAGSTGTLSGNGSGSVGLSGITFTFTGSGTINTSGGGTTAPVPTITAVEDAGSYTASIAQGSIFVVKGTNLSNTVGTFSSQYPLPTTISDTTGGSGVKITFTPTGGAGTDCPMVYLYKDSTRNQLAAVLPSTLVPGNYNVTVTNNGTTGSPFSATVVKSKFGLITRDSSGSGLALVQNYVTATQIDIDAYTSQSGISAGFPGETMVAYGTGFGAAAGSSDTTGSLGYNFAANGHTVFAVVGGMNVPVAYAGRTGGFVGLDQINFVLPGNVPTGCAVTFQVSFDNVVSPATYLSISPGAGQPCVLAGYTTAQLAQFDQGATIYGGGFSLAQFASSLNLGSGPVNVKIDSLGGQLTETSGFELTAVQGSYNVSTNTQGSCTVTTVSGSGGGTVAGGVSTNLDAGAITATGPTGSNLSGAMTETNNAYTFTLGYEGVSGIPGLTPSPATLIAGTYSLSAAGGKDVGKFNTSITVGSPLTVAGGLPTSVTRSAGVTVNFTGGGPSDVVTLIGSSTMLVGSAATTTEFTCTGPASAGSISAPGSITSQLPATSTGVLEIGTGAVSPFTAPLTAGGSINGAFVASFGTAATSVTFK